jgi:hypothetical protein
MGSRTRTLMAATTRMLELDREGVSLNIIQRQLGHANLGTTSMYLLSQEQWASAPVACRPLLRFVRGSSEPRVALAAEDSRFREQQRSPALAATVDDAGIHLWRVRECGARAFVLKRHPLHADLQQRCRS